MIPGSGIIYLGWQDTCHLPPTCPTQSLSDSAIHSPSCSSQKSMSHSSLPFPPPHTSNLSPSSNSTSKVCLQSTIFLLLPGLDPASIISHMGKCTCLPNDPHGLTLIPRNPFPPSQPEASFIKYKSDHVTPCMKHSPASCCPLNTTYSSPEGSGKPAPACLSTPPTCFFQPHCFSAFPKHSKLVSPQGLCSCYSLCLQQIFTLQAPSAQISPPQRGFP